MCTSIIMYCTNLQQAEEEYKTDIPPDFGRSAPHCHSLSPWCSQGGGGQRMTLHPTLPDVCAPPHPSLEKKVTATVMLTLTVCVCVCVCDVYAVCVRTVTIHVHDYEYEHLQL